MGQGFEVRLGGWGWGGFGMVGGVCVDLVCRLVGDMKDRGW